MPDGLCECGCGQKTRLAQQTATKTGIIRGQPQRYIYGHQNARRESNPLWHGGRKSHDGYTLVFLPGHKRADRNGYIPEHTLIAERALGKPLPDQAEVHHVNQARHDNRTSNLVICESRGYHILLHARKRALEACGNPNFRPCKFCQCYEDLTSLMGDMARGRSGGFYHKECKRLYNAQYLRARKAGGQI